MVLLIQSKYGQVVRFSFFACHIFTTSWEKLDDFPFSLESLFVQQLGNLGAIIDRTPLNLEYKTRVSNMQGACILVSFRT